MDEDIDTERPRRPKKQLKKKTTRKSIFEIYEPSELKRGHFTDMDNEVHNRIMSNNKLCLIVFGYWVA